MTNLQFKLLSKEDIPEIINLTQFLNPNIDLKTLEERHFAMFDFDNYYCFGLFKNQQLIGVSSGWITVRLYSGKQLELENVSINPNIQSKGYGHYLIEQIEQWAVTNSCLTIELNTYVQNSRSHKFYYNEGFKILGFHFQKTIKH
jgi:hypothetical protein